MTIHNKLKDVLEALNPNADPELVAKIEKMARSLLDDAIGTQRASHLVPLLANMADRISDNDLIMPQEASELARAIKTTFPIQNRSTTQKRTIEAIFASMESNSTPSERFKLTSLPTIRKATNGLERGFCVFGADPNVGKTGILIQIAMDICLNNPDAKVLFYSADDAMLSIVRRMLACHVFLNSDLDLCTPIWLTDSTYDRFDRVIGRYTIDPHRQVKKMMAVEWFFNNEKTKQLKIMCEKAGIEDLDSALEEMGENTILIADAAYKIATPYSEEKQADKHRAEGLKSISIERNTPVICAKDGRKSEKRGSDINKDTGGRKGVAMGQSDIKGDGSWGYEPDLITTMWRNEDESKIQCSVVKNKIMSFAGAFTLQNWAEYNGYKETTEVTT